MMPSNHWKESYSGERDIVEVWQGSNTVLGVHNILECLRCFALPLLFVPWKRLLAWWRSLQVSYDHFLGIEDQLAAWPDL